MKQGRHLTQWSVVCPQDCALDGMSLFLRSLTDRASKVSTGPRTGSPSRLARQGHDDVEPQRGRLLHELGVALLGIHLKSVTEGCCLLARDRNTCKQYMIQFHKQSVCQHHPAGPVKLSGQLSGILPHLEKGLLKKKLEKEAARGDTQITQGDTQATRGKARPTRDGTQATRLDMQATRRAMQATRKRHGATRMRHASDTLSQPK